MAVIYWRRHVQWRHLLRLLPWTLFGIFAGYYILGDVKDRHLMGIIGIIILALICLTTWQNSRYGRGRSIPTNLGFAAFMGILAGVTTMMANAAGPVMVIYLLAMKFDKKGFIGTSAWFFWTVNLIKIPLMHDLGLITRASILTDLALLPAILLGGFLGIRMVNHIPQKGFNAVVTLLAIIAAVHLCIKGFLT